MVKFFKTVFSHFFDSNTFQKGAALAYYAVFSLFPILLVVISIFGLLFGKEAVSGELFTQLKDLFGKEAALQIQTMVKNHHVNHNSVLTTLAGFGTLIVSASGMLGQIHNAFNTMWHIKAKPKNGILRYVTKHAWSFSILIVLFFILFLSASIDSFLIRHSEHLSPNLKWAYVYEYLISVVMVAIMFAVMFKSLGDAKVHWKPALISGMFTSVLFLLGKIGIGMIIGKSHLSTTFGAASVLALVMLWVYYTSQIIFLGASFLMVLSKKMGYDILPTDNAVKIIHTEV